MKNSKGIPANETRFIPKAQQDRITYQFVTEDDITPSACTLHLGDTDPLTGEQLTDVEFFREYYCLVNREVYGTLRSMRPEYTGERREWRRREAAAWKAEFERIYGYAPDRSEILRHLEEMEKPRYNLYYDSMRFPDDDSETEFMPEFSRNDPDPFGADLPDEVYALRELAETFTGRLGDVYEAMLANLAGGKRITCRSLAAKWGVTYNRILMDRALIKNRIRKKLGK